MIFVFLLRILYSLDYSTNCTARIRTEKGKFYGGKLAVCLLVYNPRTIFILSSFPSLIFLLAQLHERDSRVIFCERKANSALFPVCRIYVGGSGNNSECCLLLNGLRILW